MKTKLFTGLTYLFVLTVVVSFKMAPEPKKDAITITRGAEGGTFTITNKSDWNITEVYFDLEDGSTTWGEDYLESVIPPGGSLEFYNIEEGEYGIMAKDDSGDTCIHRHIPIGGDDDWLWDFDNEHCGD
jgi:hypothetical protein